MKTANYNKNVQNVVDEMNNLMIMLYDLRLLYYYNQAKPETIRNNQIITWDNHIASRANCGASFTTLGQYEHILQTGAYHCILFDGSIIRSSFTFDDNFLICHSHLWWPAPYKSDGILPEEFTPIERYEDFLTDQYWRDKIRMRSPIRIDFDPENESGSHPLVHMHTQHHESRIHIDKPMCFNKFMKYIFQNFYPDIELDYGCWNILTFAYQKPKIQKFVFSSITV